MKQENILFPTKEKEASKNKLKRLFSTNNSYFLMIKCPKCYELKNTFSSAKKDVKCANCETILGVSTGNKLKIVHKASYKVLG